MLVLSITDAKTGAFVIRGQFDPSAFHPSTSEKSVLLLAGGNTQVTGDAGIRGSVNLYVRDASALGLT